MRTRKEKPIFRGLTIAAVGSLGGSAQWSDTNIARWIGLREGRFVRDGVGVGVVAGGGSLSVGVGEGGDGGGNGDGEVTHVVCTGEEFRRAGRLVKAALKRSKTCHIVTLDWLEDSMLNRKRLDEEPYSHLRALKKERERERKRLMVIKGLEKAVREVNQNLYHLYRDRTFFQYEVVLTRDDEDAGIQGERYILSIFESNNASPHLYWFVVKYYKKKGDTQAKIHRPSHSPGIFAREFALFRSFFRMKTGIPWMQRLVKAGTTGNRVFQYQPPTGGKPVGWAPKEYIPTEVPNNAVMADVEVNTTASVPASANGNGNGNGNGIDSANLKTRPTIVTCPSAPASHRQSPSLITPARSPQPNQTMTVNPLPSQDETKAQHNPTASSSGTAPALGWPTRVDLPGAGNTNTVCAL